MMFTHSCAHSVGRDDSDCFEAEDSFSGCQPDHLIEVIKNLYADRNYRALAMLIPKEEALPEDASLLPLEVPIQPTCVGSLSLVLLTEFSYSHLLIVDSILKRHVTKLAHCLTGTPSKVFLLSFS